MRREIKRIWDFSWPVTLANITVPLLGLVDAAVLGHLNSEVYLGGVAIGTTMFTSVMWAFGFLRMGTAGLVAREAGRKDTQAQIDILINSLMLGLICALGLMLAGYLLTDIVVPWFNASEAVNSQAAIYFQTRLWGTPAILVNYVVLGWLLGVGNAKAPLLLMVVANITNIILDLVFVLGLGMATQGAALASVISDWGTLLLGIVLVRQIFSQKQISFSWHRFSVAKERTEILKQIVKVNGHLFIRTLLLLFTFAFFTAQGAKLGDTTLAANALLLNMLVLVANGLDGLAFAAESLCGHALGKKDVNGFRRIMSLTGIISLFCALLFSLAFLIGGNLLLAGLTDIESVRLLALEYLPWLQLMPLVAVMGYWLDGVFIGALRTDLMQRTMLFSVLAVFLPAWYFSQSLDNHGLWLSMALFMAGRSVAMLVSSLTIWRHPPVTAS